MAFLRISKNDFDALVVKDPNTYYIIDGKNIMYEGASTTPVNVPISKYVPTVVSIAVTTPPTKTSYLEGDILDLTGMIITGTYDNGTTEVITEYTTVPAASAVLTLQDTQITITYQGKTCTQVISVNEPYYKFYDASNNRITDISITGLVTATQYTKGSDTTKLPIGGKIFYIHNAAIEGADDKFYVLNTSVGTNGLDGNFSWGSDSTSHGTSIYNYIGGGKIASQIGLAALGDISGTIWYWLKNTVNIVGNSTSCTDWYIGSAPNVREAVLDSNSELGQLRLAIDTYPSIFAEQINWFKWVDVSHSLQMWSSIEDATQGTSTAMHWHPWTQYWWYQYKNHNYRVCAIRSF